MEFLSEKADDFRHRGLDFRQPSGEDQGTAEAVHEADLHIRAFHRNICSHHYGLPGGKTDQPDGFPRMILPFVYADVQAQVLIDTGL